MQTEKTTWQEEEALYFLNFLEEFMHENKDADKLPDGPWADACMNLDDICSAYDSGEISETTLKRKDQVFAWINSKCKPKLLADEIKQEEDMRDLMDAFASMTPEQLRQYYQAMSDDMENEVNGDPDF